MSSPQTPLGHGFAVPAFGSGRKRSSLPALAANVPPARLFNVSRPQRESQEGMMPDFQVYLW